MKSAPTRKTKPTRKKPAAKKKVGPRSPARLKKIFTVLDRLYPRAECALTHKNPFQLLVATILSAQCTDVRVNMVTPALFKKYPGPRDFARLDPKVLEEDIRSTGFFRNKSKNIIGAAKKIVEDFGGKVPQSMDEMLTLPGVARKTANVVLGTGFGIRTGVVVDTHVFRIAHRLKLSNGKTPENVENDLKELVPESRWIEFGHQVIWFGRGICQARKPLCVECPLITICDAPDKTV
jgi:endonuclease III